MINVFYNYYIDKNLKRVFEIDTCFQMLVENSEIDNLFVLAEASDIASLNTNIDITILQNRPTFAKIFEIIRKKSGKNDINIVLNSDCFILADSIKKLYNMPENIAYCLSRIDIRKAVPLKIKKLKTKKQWKKHSDMQDAWIFRGAPPQKMWLDFHMGKPGCDNRLAYEFKNFGFEIVNPRTEISIYHYHNTEIRRYGEQERVSEPYAFPEIR